MAGKVRLFSIATVQLELRKTKPPELAVTVHGYAVSSGWTDPALVPLEKTLSADGILDLDFVATPPTKVDLPMLSPQTAETVWTDGVDRLVGVRVVARSGEVIELLRPDAAQTTTQPATEETTQIAGEGPHPYWGHATTMAVGEGTAFTTSPPAEEHQTNAGRRAEAVLVDLTGPMRSERAAATTMATGEEGPPPVTTMATGEEAVFKTFEIGEETHGQTHPLLVEKMPPGEVLSAPEIEDPPPPTTPPFGEEHPPTHPGPFIEKGPQGEVASAPELETTPMTTLMVGEETPPTTAPWFEEGVSTTNVVGEDIFARPGPGRPTTLAVGEETVAKPPWGETSHRWDNPKHPWGETSPHSDDPKPGFGETWFDPQNMNPLGRR